MTPEDRLTRSSERPRPRLPDPGKAENDGLNPARGCLWGMALAAGIYTFAVFCVLLSWLLTR